MNGSAFDVALVISLLFLALQLLRSKDIFVSIVLYIVFGLVIALAWVRLKAPDIALVEASIGSGLTGALFLGTLGRIEKLRRGDSAPSFRFIGKSRYGYLFLPAIILLGSALCVAAVLALPFQKGLELQASASLAESGASNPVTAVILNFRAYDTLLEIAVLFLTLIAAFSSYRCLPAPSVSSMPKTGDKVLKFFLHIMAPLMWITAIYLLWAGNHSPGGAFQAGAILSALGFLLILGGVNLYALQDNYYPRMIAASGLTAFLLVGASAMIAGRHFLEYHGQTAKYSILIIEIFCAFSIAAIFIQLFSLCVHGGVPAEQKNEEPS